MNLSKGNGGDYNSNNGGYSSNNRDVNADKKGLAITAFVLSILGFICCGCGAVVFAPISIILAIISLATHRGAKGLAIASLIVSILSILVVVFIGVSYKEEVNDFSKFIQNSEQYVQMYKETGEVPDEFKKYEDPKYDEMWKNNNYKNFEEFYADLISKVDSGAAQGTTAGAAVYSDAFTGMNLIQVQGAV
ncbi:MAG TPA: hypothetical protein DCG30_07625 [Ruminococcus sp.]|nr:hypothetical protein [Ruminococcus sp.]